MCDEFWQYNNEFQAANAKCALLIGGVQHLKPDHLQSFMARFPSMRRVKHGVGFADSAEVTVVAGNDGNGATGFGAEGVGIVLEKIPPGKAVGKVGGLIEHAVGLIGSRERQAYATDSIPRDIVVGEEALHPIKPTRDNGFSAGG